MTEKFLDMDELLLGRVAALAIGPSTLRQMVGAGGVKAAIMFCRDEKILERVSKRSSLERELNVLTFELVECLPERKIAGGDLWGPARKVLNIVLSDATLNYRFRIKYDLNTIKDLLELPMDSHTAAGLACDCRKLNVNARPVKWPGVVHLSPKANADYLALANVIANARGFGCRARLDLAYWRSKS
jgi:hypothetical protein